jgi:hypothetical protein
LRNVSKEIFLNTLACPTLGWMMMSGTLSGGPLSPGERFRIEQGIEIGKRARNLFPGSTLVEELNSADAARVTAEVMEDAGYRAVFEGAFIAGGCVARADILSRTMEGWHLYEVKSGVNDRDEFIDDMTYTAAVLGSCGVNLTGMSLLLVSRDYRLGMSDDKLFREIDHTEKVLSRTAEFEPLLEEVDRITRSTVVPEARLIYECRGCDLFQDCMGRGIENHIFELPRLGQAKFSELAEAGICRIEDVPADFPLTEQQARARECVVSGLPFVGDGLKTGLDSVIWPAYYLDFETVITAIPLYPDTAPYTQIPCQYSIHRCAGLEDEPGHFEFLADPVRDCRRELAESLICDLGKEGSIVTYSAFEKAVVNGLMAFLPDLAPELEPLLERMVDLEAIIRKNYYHPGFHGSTSIKRTLPVLVPGMDYSGMRVADGDSAIAAFARMALGQCPPQEIETVRQDLLDYCKKDTLAMVKLHRRLIEYL